jgi:hypothetical protein
MQPMEYLIDTITKKNGSPANFNDLKDELTRVDKEGFPVYNLTLKEDEKLCLIFSNEVSTSTEKRDPKLIELEQYCRSYIIEKSTLKPIVSQSSHFIYNNDGIEYLKDKPWGQAVVSNCYEGTQLVLFNHDESWYCSTRRCLRAEDSNWIKNKSYKEMFDEAIEGKFKLDELDTNFCYHFVLVHHKNRNIVTYDYLGPMYKEIIHTFTTEKYTLRETDIKINDFVQNQEEITFSSLENLVNKISVINEKDKTEKKVSMEGYIIRFYHGEVHNSPFSIIKLQTELYQTLQKLRPNNSNVHQAYLELYQKDKLVEFLGYSSSKHKNDIVKRVHTSMRTIAKEILDLYHMTRQKKNPELYNGLSEAYKKILYSLHGLYIKQKKEEIVPESSDIESYPHSINVHDVYHYLKTLPPVELRQLFFERSALQSKYDNLPFINKGCIHLLSQQMLMFGSKPHVQK